MQISGRVSTDVDHWLDNGDEDKIEQLLLEGKSYKLEGKDTLNPKSLNFLRFLPIYKANIECLLEAVCGGNERATSELINYRNCICALHPFTFASTIHLATIHTRPAILQILLKHSRVVINSRDIEGRTPLHYASALAATDSDTKRCYDLLLEHGASDMTIDVEGYTPQDYKKIPRLVDMTQVRGLNRYPLNMDEIDGLIADRNEAALSKLVLNGEYSKIEKRIFPPQSRDLARILQNLNLRVQAVIQSVVDDDFLMLKQLIDCEEIALCRDNYGRTPLHLAVLLGRDNIVRYLLLLFPNCVDLIDRDKRTAFFYASILDDQNERDLMVALLRKAGANELSADGTTAEHNSLAAPANGQRRASDLQSIFAHSRNSVSEEMFGSDDDENVDSDIEQRILAINFDEKLYRELEEMQFQGKNDEIWKVVKKNLGNERLIRYVYSYRQVQNKLNGAIQAIAENDLKKLRSLLDLELVQTRDIKGLTILHLAVLKERHEIVEHITKSYPKAMDIVDHQGRSAAHYAAIQQNAIYDTLVDAGANVHFPDKAGFTASRYRSNPNSDVRPASPIQNTASPMPKYPSLDDTLQDSDAPSDEKLERWLAIGDIQNLEQVVLDGRSYLLMDKTSINLASADFLEGLTQYQAKIESIHKAVEEGDVRRVKSLIDRPQLSTARDRNGMTPLHKALLYGQTNTVRYLLAKYPQCVNGTDHAGRTALHYAAADPNGEHMIKVLQKSGGDAFIQDKFGHTPFYYRTHGKRLNIRTLKDNAVINQLISGQLNRPLLQDLEEDISDWIHTGNVGKLEELVLNGYADLLLGRAHQVDDTDAIAFLEVLPQYQAKIQAIHKAIEQGNLRAIKLLIDRKKMALCRDGRGLAPLHKAIVFSRIDIAKYLIRNYPQSVVNAMDQNKRTPLHYAAALRDGGYLYKLMRKAGADPNIFDCNGRPAKYYLRYPGEISLERMRVDTKQALKQVLHNRVAPSYLETNIQQWLREGNLVKLDQLLMSGCADLLLEKKSTNTETSSFLAELPTLLSTIEKIHRAVKEGDIETVRQLMTTKRLALARDRHGLTPLHTAIVYEQSEIIRFIAGNFQSVLNAPDYNKRSPMHYAAAARDGGHYLKILGKAGADPMLTDNEGRTCDYYRRNAVFDLKLLKEREDDFEMFQEQLADDVPLDEVPPSPESMSIESSNIDSSRREPNDLNTELELGDDPEDEIDETEMADKKRFERLIQEKMDIPTSDNGLYLARTVAPVLTKALAEVLLRRPADPIDFISDWLLRYNGKDNNNHIDYSS